MAGDWIKMRTDLYRDPKVSVIADILMDNQGPLGRYVKQNQQRDMTVTRNVMRNVTVGALVAVWGVARRRGRREGDDLRINDVSLAVVDDICDIPGFGCAMEATPWLEQDAKGLVFPAFFARHNVDPRDEEKEKNRLRQKRHRDAKRNVTRNAKSNARAEQRREENNNSKHNAERNACRNAGAAEKEPVVAALELVRAEGFDEKTGKELVAHANAELIRTVIRNADHLAKKGKLQNRRGYIRKGIEWGYELLPELARADRDAERRQREKERGRAEEAQRRAEDEAAAAESEKLQKRLAAMEPEELHALVQWALDTASPFTREIIGDERDPLKNAALRAQVAHILQEGETGRGGEKQDEGKR